MLVEVAKVTEIVPGGIKDAAVNGKKIVLCNFNNAFYALERKCSHRGASFDTGTLDGYILTCPLHFAQFDVRTGEALSGPVPPDAKHPTADLATYPVTVEGESIFISV